MAQTSLHKLSSVTKEQIQMIPHGTNLIAQAALGDDGTDTAGTTWHKSHCTSCPE